MEAVAPTPHRAPSPSTLASLRLREGTKPHPFAMSVYYLAEALKQLRAVGAKIDPKGFTKETVLWCGAAVEKWERERRAVLVAPQLATPHPSGLLGADGGFSLP